MSLVRPILNQFCLGFSDFVNILFAIPITRQGIAFLIGTGDVPNVAPSLPDPIIDIANGVPETTVLEIPAAGQPFVFAREGIGSPFEVGTQIGYTWLGRVLTPVPITEFSSIVRDNIDADDDDDDVRQLLQEIMTGQSGACFDYETVPGIDGVELVGLTPTTYTLLLTPLYYTGSTISKGRDRITFAGPGTAAILTDFHNTHEVADITNSNNDISLIDLGLVDDDTTLIVGDVLEDLIGTTFDGVSDSQIIYDASQIR